MFNIHKALDLLPSIRGKKAKRFFRDQEQVRAMKELFYRVET